MNMKIITAIAVVILSIEITLNVLAIGELKESVEHLEFQVHEMLEAPK